MKWGPIQYIAGDNRGRYPHCHSLYIEATQKIIVDPASDRQRLADLAQGPGVDQVWLSHYHEDHLMHLDLFEDRDIWIHPADAPALTDLEIFLDCYGMDDPGQREFWRQVMRDQFNYRPRTAAGRFYDGQEIDLGGVIVQVLHTPGHTPGHTSFFFPQEGVLYLGDYDLTRFGPWYGDKYSDIDQTAASVRRLKEVPAVVWVVGHEQGLFETDPGELWDDFLKAIDDRETQLLDFLDQPRTMTEIIDRRILYKKAREPKEFFDFGEEIHMAKHLDRLLRRGAVYRDQDRFVRC